MFSRKRQGSAGSFSPVATIERINVMRSSRIARHITRIVGGVALSAVIIGGVAAAPASAAHGVVKPTKTSTQAHGV